VNKSFIHEVARRSIGRQKAETIGHERHERSRTDTKEQISRFSDGNGTRYLQDVLGVTIASMALVSGFILTKRLNGDKL